MDHHQIIGTNRRVYDAMAAADNPLCRPAKDEELANPLATVDAAGWLVKEVNLVSSIAYLHEDFEICKHLVADGRMRLQPLHTSTVGLPDLQSAFERLASHPSEVKILVDPR